MVAQINYKTNHQKPMKYLLFPLLDRDVSNQLSHLKYSAFII
jgi:hypothetical protein